MDRCPHGVGPGPCEKEHPPTVAVPKREWEALVEAVKRRETMRQARAFIAAEAMDDTISYFARALVSAHRREVGGG